MSGNEWRSVQDVIQSNTAGAQRKTIGVLKRLGWKAGIRENARNQLVRPRYLTRSVFNVQSREWR